jgi:hypothetical protein
VEAPDPDHPMKEPTMNRIPIAAMAPAGGAIAAISAPA